MVQAIASVQLFIKRCLMGLEEKYGVHVDAIDRERWEWMQKYRVWEANRKVFLYPENWIRPELRDDKSPFYKELESELLQKDINTQTVEEALKNYLYKVDEVANLQVVGLFIEQVTHNGETTYTKLHIFGRTRSAPYFFFYRYFDIGESNWYPWEKMQVDIPSYDVEEVVNGNKTGKIIENGTYLIPVVWNNRLLVFFPQFMKKTIATASNKTISQMGELAANSLKPSEQWEIKMAWSEYRKGKWTQKQVSTEAIYNDIEPGAQICSYLFFPTVDHDPSRIAIDIYREENTVKPPEPTLITLDKATLFNNVTYDTTKINVSVVSLIDAKVGAAIANKIPLTSQPTDLYIFPTESGDKTTKDIWASFNVKINILSEDNVSEQKNLNFNTYLVLTFSDGSTMREPPNGSKNICIIAEPYYDNLGNVKWKRNAKEVNLYHIEPYGPKLKDIYLDIKTLGNEGNTGRDKDPKTSFIVDLADQNDESFVALIPRGGDEEYDEGEPLGDIVITPNREITAAECQKFNVSITQWKGVNDWGFDAKVTLNFEKTLNNEEIPAIKAQKNHIILNNAMNSDSFTSEDSYPYKPLKQPPTPPNKVDYKITQRFEFLGNKFTIVDVPPNDPVQKLDLQDYRFQYEISKRIHSLQAEDGKTPVLMDGVPYFDDANKQLAIIDKQPRLFGYLSIYKLLGVLNTDQIDNLYNYFLALYDTTDPVKKAEMEEVFGAPYNDKDQPSYHELKRPYSLYNWEVCFHAPMHLVEHLLKSQQFDQALAMCHYVFNPLAKPNPADLSSKDITRRCWQFPPFKIDAKKVLETLFSDLQPGKPNKKITEWRDKPFQPHVIARGRPSAYMKYVVAKYIEILIAYGDYYFRQNTMESIPMAIQCYVMASHLYGPRGQKIPRRGKTRKQTYKSLLDKWDAFGNAMVELELAFPFSNQSLVFPESGSNDVPVPNIFGFASTLYFGIPYNSNLTALRNTIDDRLMKIRICENIEGIFQQLPLFEPPIDPALLVQAAAQGLSLSSVLNDMNSPMPNYRFYYLLQKALELCGELKALGSAFLSAKEKGDAEALSNMRAAHEKNIQNLVMEVRKQQLEEASKSLEALQQSRKSPMSRMKYYLQLIGENDLSKVPDESTDFSDLPNQLEQPVDESGLKLIGYEKEEMDKASEANDQQSKVAKTEKWASAMHALPNISFQISVGVSTSLGGSNIGSALQAYARFQQGDATDYSHQSARASRKGGFLRQLQDRVQQANAAGYEIKNIDKQILTQQIRIAIAKQEINNQQRQIDNTREVEDFLRNKYTNADLYSWMEDSIRTLYNQVYTLAYDLAKKAEKAYRFERPMDSSSNFIQFGYWDAGRDGLLSGERLHLALKQLEKAYQEKRGYHFEITKHVSLRQLNPFALIQLRSGSCEFALPEVLFDMDYPGHYLRRIKSVALTIPCVTGPYTSLNCTLRLQEHKFRINPISGLKDYEENKEETDSRFSTVNVPITAIAVSAGQNDSGVFELNFRDERYIPFEGAGAISKWSIELPPKEFSQFDYNTISDVVMHLRYTASDGGENLKRDAVTSVKKFIKANIDLGEQEGLFALFDLKYDFPNEWSAFINPNANTQPTSHFTARIRKDYFPYITQGRSIKFTDDPKLYVQNKIEKLPVDQLKIDPNDNQAYIVTIPGNMLPATDSTEAQAFLIIRYSLSGVGL